MSVQEDNRILTPLLFTLKVNKKWLPIKVIFDENYYEKCIHNLGINKHKQRAL